MRAHVRAYLWLLLSSRLATSELFPDEAARAGADPYPIARGDASAEPAEVVIDLAFGRKTRLALPRARGASEAAHCLAKARAIRRNATLARARFGCCERQRLSKPWAASEEARPFSLARELSLWTRCIDASVRIVRPGSAQRSMPSMRMR